MFFSKKLKSAYRLPETAKLSKFRKRNISLANFSDSKKTKTRQNKDRKYRQKNIVWFELCFFFAEKGKFSRKSVSLKRSL